MGFDLSREIISPSLSFLCLIAILLFLNLGRIILPTYSFSFIVESYLKLSVGHVFIDSFQISFINSIVESMGGLILRRQVMFIIDELKLLVIISFSGWVVSVTSLITVLILILLMISL